MPDADAEHPLIPLLREWQPSGMWANVGARLTEIEPGRVVVEAQLTAERHGFPGPGGEIIHGGATASVADMALASAAASLCREGESCTTVDLRVEYFRPGRPGRVVARASVRRRTARLAFCEVSLELEDGTVFAEGRAVLAYGKR